MNLRISLSFFCATLVALATGCPADDDGEGDAPSLATTGDATEADGSGATAGPDDTETSGVGTTLDGDDTGAGDTGSSDGTDTGEPVAEVWNCVGRVERPPFVEGDAPIDVTIVAFPGGRPLADLSVLVCYDDDTTCTEPHASGTSSAAGTLTIDVPTDAPIHYRVTGDAITPSLFFRRGVPPTAGEPVELGGLTPDTLEAFVQITGARPMADRGHLVMTARDCDAELASGVRFEIDTADADSTIVYLDGGIPSADASQTDVSGRGGVLNLPAGPVTVTAFLAETNTRIGDRTIFIEAGIVSLVGVVPSP